MSSSSPRLRLAHLKAPSQLSTCYRAANWTVLGITAGLGKDARGSIPNRSLKQLLGYPLVRDFRKRLQGQG